MSRHWQPPRKTRRSTAGEFRLTLLSGLFLGLFLAFAGGAIRPWSDGSAAADSKAFPEAAPATDPYAEARRSRAIFAGQEAGPLPGGARAGAEVQSRHVDRDDEVDVIDGDTFRLGGTKIRIADIDTPEVKGRCAAETALAARATERLEALLAQRPFTLEPSDRDEDRYGRKLRIVTRGGRSIGDQLVAEGLARRWTGRRESWCA